VLGVDKRGDKVLG